MADGIVKMKGKLIFSPEKPCAVAVFLVPNLIVFSGEGTASGNYGYANSGYSVYEEENEKLTESLRSKVTAIKSVSISLWLQH